MKNTAFPKDAIVSILVGIREDLGDVDLPRLVPSPAPKVIDVLKGLPRLRSGLSPKKRNGKSGPGVDGFDQWKAEIERLVGVNGARKHSAWLAKIGGRCFADVRCRDCNESGIAKKRPGQKISSR